MKSAFDPNEQINNIDLKLVYSLERISQVYKAMLLKTQTITGLSPIQIQMLLFIYFHEQKYVSISLLALEFKISKATTSDAIKVLINKNILTKTQDSIDKRRQNILLTKLGINMIENIKNYAYPIQKNISNISINKKHTLFNIISELLLDLTKDQLITLRLCTTCKYYEIKNNKHYCNLVKLKLENEDIRLDCPEHIIS